MQGMDFISLDAHHLQESLLMHPDASANQEVSSRAPVQFSGSRDGPAQTGSLWVPGVVGEAEPGHAAA